MHTGNMEASYPVQIEHWNDILGQYYLNFLRKKKKRKNKERKEKEGRHLKSDVMTMPFRNGGRIIKSSSSL